MNEKLSLKYLEGILNALNNGIPTKQVVRKIDEINANLCYVGYAELNTLTADVQWSVKKVTNTTIEYGQGPWDDRLILTYL